ncbi:MAG: hypothetical protein ACKO38_09650 [Planctomycetota bacterium]
MTPQVVDTVIQLRWFIAIVVAVITVVWIVQNGKTKRLALLCAVVENIEDLPSIQAIMERISSENSSAHKAKRIDLPFAAIVEAFSKTNKDFQIMCSIGCMVFLMCIGAGIIQSIALNSRGHIDSLKKWPPTTAAMPSPLGLSEISIKKEVREQASESAVFSLDDERVGTGRFSSTATHSRLSYAGDGFHECNMLMLRNGI